MFYNYNCLNLMTNLGRLTSINLEVRWKILKVVLLVAQFSKAFLKLDKKLKLDQDWCQRMAMAS